MSRSSSTSRLSALTVSILVSVTASIAATQPHTASFIQNNRFTSYAIQNVAASPDGLHVFASGTGDSTAIFSFVIQDDGSLQQAGQPAMDAIASRALLAVHPGGGTLYAAFSSGYNTNAKLVAYAVNTQTGTLTNPAASAESTNETPTALVLDPTGSFLYVLRGNLAVYALPESGAPSLVTDYDASGISGVSLALSPDGRFAVVASGASTGVNGWVRVYPRNTETGELISAAIDSARTATPSPRQLALLPNRVAYLTENTGSGTDSISRYAVDSATGHLTARRPATPVATYSDVGGSTAGPFLAAAPTGSFVMVTGFETSDGTWGSHPGYVSSFNVNNDGSLELNNTITAEVNGTYTGGIAPASITIEPYGQYAYTANKGNAYTWEAVDAYATGYSPFDVGNLMSRGVHLSFNGDSLVFTDTLLVPRSGRTAEDVASAGFALFRLGFDYPKTQSHIHAFTATATPTTADAKFLRAAAQIPLTGPTNNHHLFEDSVYAVRAYVVTNQGTFYGPSTTPVNVTPFVSTEPLGSAYIWAYGGAVLLNGSVRADRIPARTGFKVSTTGGFTDSATRIYAGSRIGTNFTARIYRDSLKHDFTLRYPAIPLDTFYVKPYGVFGLDTIYGDSIMHFTNAPLITMQTVSTTSTSATFRITVQPWVFSGPRIKIEMQDASATSGWKTKTSCFNQADCTVSGLTPGRSYTFRGVVDNTGSFRERTASATVSTPSN